MKILIEHFITSLKSSLGIRRQNKENIIFFFKIWIIRFFFAFPKIRNFNKAKIDSRIIEKKLLYKKIEVKIISHKTLHPYYGEKINLHDLSKKWIKKNIKIELRKKIKVYLLHI